MWSNTAARGRRRVWRMRRPRMRPAESERRTMRAPGLWPRGHRRRAPQDEAVGDVTPQAEPPMGRRTATFPPVTGRSWVRSEAGRTSDGGTSMPVGER